jgi:hypothetical protein
MGISFGCTRESKPLYTLFIFAILKRGMEKTAIIAIVLIVLISVIAVISVNSFTGAYTSHDYELLAGSSYGASKLYGGAIRKAIATNPEALSKKYSEEQFILRAQDYLYANKDKWDCSFGDEALGSAYPCVYEESLGKYCCVLPEI